jgi:hypothetical protein
MAGVVQRTVTNRERERERDYITQIAPYSRKLRMLQGNGPILSILCKLKN